MEKPAKLRHYHLTIDEEYSKRLKKLITHRGQQMHEMRLAIIERIEKLERQQQEKKAS